MRKSDYYEKVHKREMKTLQAALNLIRKGVLLVASARLDKEFIGNGYRLTVYLREKNNEQSK